MIQTRMTLALLNLTSLVVAFPVLAAERRVCVEVALQETPDPADATDAKDGPAKPRKSRPAWLVAGEGFLPVGQTPVVYLKRLMEHFITHEEGFVSVADKCEETVRVELYPLAEGWTVFARYSGHGREERVDQLFPSELTAFAERASLALLYNRPIGTTINRENVLRADSAKASQRITGTNHFAIHLGTTLRGGKLDTRVEGSPAAPTESKIRVFSPMTLGLGYRGKFESWGIDASTQLGFGTSKVATKSNDLGGHVDYGGNWDITLHFLNYADPRGLNSLYYGAGSTFELLWFSVIAPAPTGTGGKPSTHDNRATLYGGGLSLDLVAGWEFMRASAVQFFLQGELKLPAYVLQNEDNSGKVQTWFPGVGLKIGMLF